jgi:hypothetical protein
MVAQLEAVLRQPAHLLVPPRSILSLDAAIAEEGPAGLGAGQHAERRLARPVGPLALEVEPDSDGAARIDLERAILPLDVAELAGRGVVEGEYHRRVAGRQIDAAVDELGDRDRPVAAIVQHLEVAAEVGPLARPAALLVADEVIHEDRHAAVFVRRQIGAAALAWPHMSRRRLEAAESIRRGRPRRQRTRDFGARGRIAASGAGASTAAVSISNAAGSARSASPRLHAAAPSIRPKTRSLCGRCRATCVSRPGKRRDHSRKSPAAKYERAAQSPPARNIAHPGWNVYSPTSARWLTRFSASFVSRSSVLPSSSSVCWSSRA